MSFYTRKLEEEDMEEIVLLRVELRRYASINEKFDLDEKRLREETRKYLKDTLNKELYMFGGFIDDELVSICGFNLLKDFPDGKNKNGNVAYVCSVFTKEEHRRKGYQKKLMKQCMEEAKNMGIYKFKLSTVNPEAVEMYKKLGFVFDEDAMKMKIKEEKSC